MAQQELQQLETIIGLSASELVQKIKVGHLSAQAVVEAHIKPIEAVNPQLNAVVIPLFKEALTQAVEADKARRRGEPLGPLHGVPVTVKEQFRVKGTQTTLGATNKIGNIYRSERPLVNKLRQAGAIILGKTNIIQTLAGWESDNHVYGRTNNPFRKRKTASTGCRLVSGAMVSALCFTHCCQDNGGARPAPSFRAIRNMGARSTDKYWEWERIVAS